MTAPLRLRCLLLQLFFSKATAAQAFRRIVLLENLKLALGELRFSNPAIKSRENVMEPN